MNTIRYRTHDFVPTSYSAIVDKFLNGSIGREGGSTFSPSTDVAETEKSFEIQLAVPGMKKEDFKLEVNENQLTISGERKFNDERKEKDFQLIESRYGSFSRSFRLPENVDASKINARYINGILEVTLPKDESKLLKSTIAVN